MVSLKEFTVANIGGKLVQDDEIDLNHDGDSLTLGLGTYKELVYHVIVKSKVTTFLGASSTKTEKDEDRKLTKGQVTIVNSESAGAAVGTDRNTKVLFVRATDASGSVVKASPEAGKAIAGSRAEASKEWWNKWWWVVVIVVIVAGVVSAWVIVSYMRRGVPSGPIVSAPVTASMLPAPVPVPVTVPALPGPPGVG